MKIHLHIGLESCGADRMQDVLAEKRDQLAAKGVLFPRVVGAKNHTRLFMAVTAPEQVDPLRFNRGFITEEKQTGLRDFVAEGLLKAAQEAKPDVMILSASQLATSLTTKAELETLKAVLSPISDDITVTAYVDEPARALSRHYAEQVMEGRARSLGMELKMLEAPDWWEACLERAPEPEPDKGLFLRTQTPAFWLDYPRLVAHWESVFGAGNVRLRTYDPEVWSGMEVTEELRAAFDITQTIGKAAPWEEPAEPSAAWLTRGRQINAALLRLLGTTEHVLPRQLWKRFVDEVKVDGAPLDAAMLSPISRRFAPGVLKLAETQPGLNLSRMAPVPAGADWAEADPEMGFRASQYLLAWFWRIEKASADEAKAKLQDVAVLNGDSEPEEKPDPAEMVSDEAREVLSPAALEKYAELQSNSFKPHNRLGRVQEDVLEEAFPPAPPRELPEGSTGRVIVGCMKNEAPYIIEWVAYHRAIGFDNFLIYTNDCTDGTDRLLQRLDAMGIVHHRNNDGWQGNSPQQYALDAALEEPVIKNAEWIAHIDVDEFVNIRVGNGTLDDVFARVPKATNVAMTWRLFGHNGVTALADAPVIEQFSACAPKFCPKPHTAWGFKTMTRNIGAYEKLSCHRPNKLVEDKADKVVWVNGSGQPMTKEVIKNGWRNSKRSIGYDMIQLNHYALRSAESYLIKRQRGRALHVDRSIGLSYWIRMDWCDHPDLTIQRNLPRMRAEIAALMADPDLCCLHDEGFRWHQAKAKELHDNPEFQDLYDKALTIKLNATERVAFALSLDVDS
ncbi:glycosyltransferase family 2 protein [Pseudooceanicola sp. C21-150M6]|uniref:glycosyltransferase family 2 protein n=1 Tax=Pseudooceanicola sp. C21-150M6 TaxID=3434355 RepID=UPI003D7F6E30